MTRDPATTPGLTRRAAIGAGLALPLAVGMPAQLRAAAPAREPRLQRANRFMRGALEVHALQVMSMIREKPQSIFGLNVTPEKFAEVAAANRIPTDRMGFSFTPTLINTGSELVLFDTGLNPGVITAALAEAGYTPDQVDIVVITHMHGDHIGGLMGEGGPTFANARYITGRAEYDFWAAAGNEAFDKNMRPLAGKTTFIEDGGAAASGMTAIAAPGHTAGHTAWMIENDGAQLLLMADTANHHVFSLAHPDWEVSFDFDKAQAAATRRRLLGMAADDGIPVLGYHMPFPATGFIERRGDGFHWVPTTYELAL